MTDAAGMGIVVSGADNLSSPSDEVNTTGKKISSFGTEK